MRNGIPTEHYLHLSARVRDVLSRVDEVLSHVDADSRALWYILTALRGPDFEAMQMSNQYKNYVTCPIRRAALPLTANSADLGLSFADFRSSAFADVSLRSRPYGGLDVLFEGWNVSTESHRFHFLLHAAHAAEALKLTPGTRP